MRKGFFSNRTPPEKSEFTSEELRLFSDILSANPECKSRIHRFELESFVRFLESRGESETSQLEDGMSQLLLLSSTGNSLSGHSLVRACGTRIGNANMAYKCLDCGADPTCIMCVNCFLQSPCTNHRFRLVRSGGGTCDCGDPEAWNPAGFCKLHQNSDDSNWTGGDPKMRSVFGSIFRFLCSASELQNPRPSAAKVTLLSWLLKKAESSPAIRDSIAGSLCLSVEDPPRTDTRLLSLFARHAIRQDPDSQGFVVALLLTMLPIYDFKAALGQIFSDVYLEVLRSGLGSEFVAKLSVQLLTVPSISQRIAFGCDSAGTGGLLHAMIRWMRDTLSGAVMRPTAAATPSWDCSVDCSNEVLNFQTDKGTIFWRAIHSTKYLARHRAVAARFLETLVDSTMSSRGRDECRGSSPWMLLLQTLRCMQWMDPSIRATRMHVLIENNTWHQAFSSSASLAPLIDLVVAAISCPPPTTASGSGSSTPTMPAKSSADEWDWPRARRAARACAAELAAWMRRRGMGKLLDAPCDEDVVLYRVSQHAASFHLPLHRALARCVLEMVFKAPDWSAATSGADSRCVGRAAMRQALGLGRLPAGMGRCLVEHPLRVAALSAQVGCGSAWVRNGYAMMSQNAAFLVPSCAHRGRDMDLLLLQACCVAGISSPARLATAGKDCLPSGGEKARVSVRQLRGGLMRFVAESFELVNFLRLDAVCPPPPLRLSAAATRPVWPEVELQCAWAEEALRLVVTVIGARDFTGDLSRVARVRRAVVHCLAREDCTHSQIMQWMQYSPASACEEGGVSENEVDSVLAVVADRTTAPPADRSAAASAAGVRYRLRAEAWAEVDPHSVCVRLRREQQQVEARMEVAHSADNTTFQGRIAPWCPRAGSGAMPPLRPPFAPLAWELRSPTLLRALFVLLHNAAGRLQQSLEAEARRTSDFLVRETVQLLYMGLEAARAEEADTVQPTASSIFDTYGDDDDDTSMDREDDIEHDGEGEVWGNSTIGGGEKRAAQCEVEQNAGWSLVAELDGPEVFESSLYEQRAEAKLTAAGSAAAMRDFFLNGGAFERNGVREGAKRRGLVRWADLMCEEVSCEAGQSSSILSLLIAIAKHLPPARARVDHLGDAIRALVLELSQIDPRCHAAVAHAGIRADDGAAAEATAEEEEEARRRHRKLAAERQHAMMEEMRQRQAAAAAAMMGSESDEDDVHTSNAEAINSSQLVSNVSRDGWSAAANVAAGGGGGLERLRELEGQACALCQEAMRCTPSTGSGFSDAANWSPVVLVGFGCPTGMPGCGRELAPSLKKPSAPSAAAGGLVRLCGHAVHGQCLRRYRASLESRRDTILHGQTFEEAHNIDMDFGEFICPICRQISNLTLAVPPPPPSSPSVLLDVGLQSDSVANVVGCSQSDASWFANLMTHLSRSSQALDRSSILTQIPESLMTSFGAAAAMLSEELPSVFPHLACAVPNGDGARAVGNVATLSADRALRLACDQLALAEVASRSRSRGEVGTETLGASGTTQMAVSCLRRHAAWLVMVATQNERYGQSPAFLSASTCRTWLLHQISSRATGEGVSQCIFESDLLMVAGALLPVCPPAAAVVGRGAISHDSVSASTSSSASLSIAVTTMEMEEARCIVRLLFIVAMVQAVESLHQEAIEYRHAALEQLRGPGMQKQQSISSVTPDALFSGGLSMSAVWEALCFAQVVNEGQSPEAMVGCADLCTAAAALLSERGGRLQGAVENDDCSLGSGSEADDDERGDSVELTTGTAEVDLSKAATSAAAVVGQRCLILLRQIVLLLHYAGYPVASVDSAAGDQSSAASTSCSENRNWESELLTICEQLGLQNFFGSFSRKPGVVGKETGEATSLWTAALAPAGSPLAELVATWILQRTRGFGRSAQRKRTFFAGADETALSSAIRDWMWARPARPAAFGPLHLTSVPAVFQDLVNRRRGRLARAAGLSGGAACLCLVCGAVITAPTDQVRDRDSAAKAAARECAAHSRGQHGGVGVFLRISEAVVVIIQDDGRPRRVSASARTNEANRPHGCWQAVWGSIYVDEYGEEDRGLVRGARLTLDPSRWARLESLWVTQHLRAWSPSSWHRRNR